MNAYISLRRGSFRFWSRNPFLSVIYFLSWCKSARPYYGSLGNLSCSCHDRLAHLVACGENDANFASSLENIQARGIGRPFRQLFSSFLASKAAFRHSSKFKVSDVDLNGGTRWLKLTSRNKSNTSIEIIQIFIYVDFRVKNSLMFLFHGSCLRFLNSASHLMRLV